MFGIEAATAAAGPAAARRRRRRRRRRHRPGLAATGACSTAALEAAHPARADRGGACVACWPARRAGRRGAAAAAGATRRGSARARTGLALAAAATGAAVAAATAAAEAAVPSAGVATAAAAALRSGGTSWLSTWNISSVGRKRSAAAGMRSTLVLRATSMLTFAVMPGFSFSSAFGTAMTVE